MKALWLFALTTVGTILMIWSLLAIYGCAGFHQWAIQDQCARGNLSLSTCESAGAPYATAMAVAPEPVWAPRLYAPRYDGGPPQFWSARIVPNGNGYQVWSP